MLDRFIAGLDDELTAHDYVLLVRHGTATPQAVQRTLDAIAPRAVLRFADAYLTGHELEDSGGWRDGLAAHVALQVGHLGMRGHTRIAVALPERDNPLSEARLHFTIEVAAKLGIDPPARFAVPRLREAAAAALRGFRAAHPGVTAIAAYSDDIALRVLTAAFDLGVRVPGDLAVIGHDETEHAALATPALTTVRIDAETYGRQAARAILGLPPGDLAPAPARIIARLST
jgi:DNA-binding LacI/PurR family transcriptional regulator